MTPAHLAQHAWYAPHLAWVAATYRYRRVLSYAEPTRAIVRGSLAHVVLRGAVLRGADLAGVNLEHADLRSVDLRGADLRGACLAGARCDGARFAGACLGGADIGRAVNADFGGAVLRTPEGPVWDSRWLREAA